MSKQILKKLTVFIFFSAFMGIGMVSGQDAGSEEGEEMRQIIESQKPGNTTFLLSGYANSGFKVVDSQSSFVGGRFAPVFVWKHGDRFLFETELEIAYENEDIEFFMEYANVSYILNDYLVVRFGNFLTPFGIFGERLHPAWINPLPTNPLGFDHHNPAGPFAELGIELRGGAPLGSGRINYAVYLSNGPRLHVDTGDDAVEVSTSYQNFGDNNDSKAIGGRIGILPFSNSSLELGLSGQIANKIGDRDTEFEEIGSRMVAADLTMVKNSISAIKGNINLKAQWNYVDEDQFQLIDAVENVTDVDNDLSAYFAMLSYRPSLSGSRFIRRIELTGRYSAFNIINNDSFIAGEDEDGHVHAQLGAVSIRGSESTSTKQGSAMNSVAVTDDRNDDNHGALLGDSTQWSFGLTYWLSWRSALKFSYQVTNNDGDEHGFFVQYALGF